MSEPGESLEMSVDPLCVGNCSRTQSSTLARWAQARFCTMWSGHIIYCFLRRLGSGFVFFFFARLGSVCFGFKRVDFWELFKPWEKEGLFSWFQALGAWCVCVCVCFARVWGLGGLLFFLALERFVFFHAFRVGWLFFVQAFGVQFVFSSLGFGVFRFC